MKVLYLSGFLSSKKDLMPLALKGETSTFVDIEKLVLESEDINSYIVNNYGKGFDLAVGYSFGGRIIGELSREVVSKKAFISSWVSPVEEAMLLQREASAKLWKEKFSESYEKAIKEWSSLELFGGHSMSDYRKINFLDESQWSLNAIIKYFDEYFIGGKILRDISAQDLYIYGENDSKYSLQSHLLKTKLQVRSIPSTGHRCCFEKPEAIKRIINELCS